ncbi:MAG: hypothetical protein AAF443_04390 [Chlamydiota bacterium]
MRPVPKTVSGLESINGNKEETDRYIPKPIQSEKRSAIWRGYFDRLFSWVLIRQVDKTQGKIGQMGPQNSAIFFQFESARVYSASGSKAPKSKLNLKFSRLHFLF